MSLPFRSFPLAGCSRPYTDFSIPGCPRLLLPFAKALAIARAPSLLAKDGLNASDSLFLSGWAAVVRDTLLKSGSLT